MAYVRWSILAVVVFLIAALAWRLWFVAGLVRRISIDGPSMAPALFGRRYDVVCQDCSFVFPCDAEHVPADERAACPNCGYPANDLNSARSLGPDRVLIDAWPLLWRRPEVGEVWAFAAPTSQSDLAVKRVASIGGQSLAIHGGDLYVGGTIVRKSLAELHAVQVLVHDQAYQPRTTANLPPRWQATTAGSRWTSAAAGFRAAPRDGASAGLDWLVYTHWPCTANAQRRGVASPVTDNDAFNQGETHRTLNVVPDVQLTCRLRVVGSGRLALAAVDGDQRFELEIEPHGRLVLRRGATPLLEQPFPLRLGRGSNKLEFGLCDRQVVLAIGGRTIVRHRYERPAGPQAEALHPLAIGVGNAGLAVDELRVWRDIYYLDSQGLPRSWQSPHALARRQIAVLGDNQPVSIDSRHFDPPGIPHNRLLGRVYRPFWAGPRGLHER